MSKLSMTIKVILMIFIISIISAKIIEFSVGREVVNDGIAIIKIQGPITSESTSSPFLGESIGAGSIIENIEKANKNPSIKGIILEINSPGGTVVASREVANAVKNIDKPTVAWIRELGASGAYWIASAADVIVADELSITGSIGVTSSYLEFSGLFEKYGIGYEELKAGENKEVGSPFRKLTDKERNLLQEKLDKIHEIFIQEVAENRNLDQNDVKELSTGIFYLGIEAKELGLVDVLGGKDLVEEQIKELTGIENPEYIEYRERRPLFDYLTRASAYYIGRGIGAELKSTELNPSTINIIS